MEKEPLSLRGVAQIRTELETAMQEGDAKAAREQKQRNIKLIAGAIEHELALLTALLAELVKNNGG